MTRLSVNINKFATLRNARGGNNPDVVKAAVDCERFGAQGITVHPRPDERHIRYSDVLAISQVITTEFNLEGYPDDRYLEIIRKVRPAQATLVPDGPHVLTSDAGWDTVSHQEFLKKTIVRLKQAGAGRVSLFVNPDPHMVEAAATAGADRVELYTEPYARDYVVDPARALASYRAAAQAAGEVGLGLNAGHDLDLNNLRYLKLHLPNLDEVSVGHALVCDALYFGLENTVRMYLYRLREEPQS